MFQKNRQVIKKKKEKKFFSVYIVQCKFGTYYTGSTNNLENRIKLHNCGKGAKYLRGKGPVKLVYSKKCRSHNDALRLERMIKQLARKEKIALIKADA